MRTPLRNTAHALLPDLSRMVVTERGKWEQVVIMAESCCSEPWKERAVGKPGTCLALSQIPHQQQHGQNMSQ